MAGLSPKGTAEFRVLAMVLNYNGGCVVGTCVDALATQTHAALDILLIDNASSDGSVERVLEKHPGVEVIQNAENLGFCAANNQGLDRVLAAGYDAGLLVNDDVVLEPDSVERLAAVLEGDPSVGVAGPKVLFEPERDFIWCAGGVLDGRQNLNRLRGHWQPARAFSEAEDVDYIPGCALLVRRQALQKAGFLEADYFAYLEDVEFCFRVRKAGFRVRYEAAARAYHHVSRSSGDRYPALRKYLNARNSVHFLRRHGTLRTWLGFWIFDVSTLVPLLVWQSLRGRGGAAWAKARGIWRGFRGETGRPEL